MSDEIGCNRIKLPWRVRDAGAHDHATTSDGVKTNFTGGEHAHILPDMKTILMGGEHYHGYMAGSPQVQDGKHVHKVLLEDGTELMTESGGGPHVHEVLPGPKVSYDSGQHSHTIKMADGTVQTTLDHAAIQGMMDKIQKNFDVEEEPVDWALEKLPLAKSMREKKLDQEEGNVENS